MIHIFISAILILASYIILNSPGTLKHLALENAALRHQLSVLRRSSKRPRFRKRDRLFWVFLSRVWKDWRQATVIVKPETIIKWHRQGFKAYWKLKSATQKKPGRPKVSPEIQKLVREMATENPLWGAPRIHGELIKLGFDLCEKTVSNLLRSIHRKPPSQTWRTFLKNHTGKVSVDFFTVPTAWFKVLYVFIILSNDRRRIVQFNVTANPTSKWVSQQVVEAFPYDTVPKYLMRDRDAIYGNYFKKRIKNMGITEVISAPKSPWQNPFVERVIGTLRRECLDHVVALNERHLKRILTDYIDYYAAKQMPLGYNNDRTHYNLAKDTPHQREVQHKPGENSNIIKLPRVGGLHHRYEWKDAA